MRLNQSEFVVKQDNVQAKYYTRNGLQDYVDQDDNPRLSTENNNVFAKAIRKKLTKSFVDNRNAGYSFYVKADPNRNLYNPMDLHTIEPKIKKSFINKICKSELVFIEVPESVFNKYLTFLRTENTQWLTDAQREIK